jgi:hypothetical protein
VAWYVAVAVLRAREVAPHPPVPGGLAEYTAVMHVHSGYSHDGRGTLDEIAAAAARAGVRVVFLTDHNTLASLGEGHEGWYGSTLILVGAEITTGSGYLLLLDPRADLPVRARGFALDDLLQRYRAAGALILVAHPEHPRLGWRDTWPEADGLEVIDVFDQIVATTRPRQLFGLLAYPANPALAILSVIHWPRGVLDRWDGLMRERPTLGVLGLDAHGGIALTEERDLNFPSHETAFRVGRMHFVTPEPLREDAADRTRVYRALRAGHFFNAFDGLAPATGFRFEARHAGGRALMGETMTAREGLRLWIRIPPGPAATVRVLRDGQVVAEGPPGPDSTVEVAADAPGVYRVEVDLEAGLFPLSTARVWPWIFSNPIYVRP